MKRIVFSAIDLLMLYGVSRVVYDAHGLAWSIVAVIAVAAYSVVSYIDGMTRA